MALNRRRRGQVYSLIAILLSVPVVLFMTATLSSLQEAKSSVTEKIVADQLALVAKSIEEDFNKAVETSIKRAFIAATNYVFTNSSYFSIDSTYYVVEAMLNGSINGQPQYVMVNNTLKDWKDRLLAVQSGFEVDFNYTTPAGNFNRTDIVGDYGLTLRVADRFGIARIEKTDVRKKFTVSIEGLEDPVFALETNGLIRRTYKMYEYAFYARRFSGLIASRNFTGNVSFNASLPTSQRATRILVNETLTGHRSWGCVIAESGTPNPGQQPCYVLGVASPVATINATINELSGYNVLYVDNVTNAAWSLPLNRSLEPGNERYYEFRGPDPFERLSGDVANSSDVGIMAILNTDQLKAKGGGVTEGVTRVEWVYFWTPGKLGHQFRSFPSWFLLDDNTTTFFNVTDLQI
ncbi:MAG: hypothetical protein HY369_04825 [Candidatus Aenigmarchaeota archaeon]|nr:hypothetical protein [Candidatus Aenigmarchaeota archaeon]